MAAKRFVIDSQTFTQAMWFIIPGGMAYAYAHFATEDEETKEKHLNENYIATTKSARKGSTALGPIFAQRQKDGKFNPEMEKKLDDLLRSGNKKRVRVNTDNENFHLKNDDGDGDDVDIKNDWRFGLKGHEIVKEQKKQRKLYKKNLRKLNKRKKNENSLLNELYDLRLNNSNNSNIEERKKEIKRQCLKMGIDYNKPWKPPLVAIGTTSDN